MGFSTFNAEVNFVRIRKFLFGWGIAFCVAILLLAGCRSIPSADVQAFSTGVSAARSQTDTAFLAVTDLTTDSIIDYAASQATLKEANFLPVLDPEAIAVWDNVFSALEKYSQSLVLLTSPNLTSDYESAAVNLADQIKQTGSKLESKKLAGSAPAVPPSFAAAFTELGEILLRAKAQHDAIRIASQTDPKIQSILSVMADNIGATRNEGLRGTAHANWEQRKGTQQVAFLGTKEASARRAVTAQYASLLKQQGLQDLALGNLHRSLLALANAHHALANGRNADLASAVATVEQGVQNTEGLANRFSAGSKPTPN